MKGARSYCAPGTEDGWSHAGRHFNLKNVSIYPKPVQKPHPPLWISARNQVAARRAARFGMPLLIAPPPYVADEQAVYTAYVEQLQRMEADPAGFGVGGSFNVIVTDDPEGYRTRVRPGAAHRARLYEDWYSEAADISDDADRIPARPNRPTGVIGDAVKCIGALDRFLAGPIPYTHVIMGLDGAAELEAFAARVRAPVPVGRSIVGKGEDAGRRFGYGERSWLSAQGGGGRVELRLDRTGAGFPH